MNDKPIHKMTFEEYYLFQLPTAKQYAPGLRWPGYGLPPARHVLLPGDLKAFTDVGEEVVAHGGIALEEVLVPFVAIAKEGT